MNIRLTPIETLHFKEKLDIFLETDDLIESLSPEALAVITNFHEGLTGWLPDNKEALQALLEEAQDALKVTNDQIKSFGTAAYWIRRAQKERGVASFAHQAIDMYQTKKLEKSIIAKIKKALKV